MPPVWFMKGEVFYFYLHKHDSNEHHIIFQFESQQLSRVWHWVFHRDGFGTDVEFLRPPPSFQRQQSSLEATRREKALSARWTRNVEIIWREVSVCGVQKGEGSALRLGPVDWAAIKDAFLVGPEAEPPRPGAADLWQRRPPHGAGGERLSRQKEMSWEFLWK